MANYNLSAFSALDTPPLSSYKRLAPYVCARCSSSASSKAPLFLCGNRLGPVIQTPQRRCVAAPDLLSLWPGAILLCKLCVRHLCKEALSFPLIV